MYDSFRRRALESARDASADASVVATTLAYFVDSGVPCLLHPVKGDRTTRSATAPWRDDARFPADGRQAGRAADAVPPASSAGVESVTGVDDAGAVPVAGVDAGSAPNGDWGDGGAAGAGAAAAAVAAAASEEQARAQGRGSAGRSAQGGLGSETGRRQQRGGDGGDGGAAVKSKAFRQGKSTR